MNPSRESSAMRRVLAIQLVLAGLLLAGCGAVSVSFVSNPQLPPSSFTGKIAIVVLGTVNDPHGSPLTVTTTSFINAGLASTLNFCGDQRSRLTVGDVVRVDFTSETSCLFLVNVFVLS